MKMKSIVQSVQQNKQTALVLCLNEASWYFVPIARMRGFTSARKCPIGSSSLFFFHFARKVMPKGPSPSATLEYSCSSLVLYPAPLLKERELLDLSGID